MCVQTNMILWPVLVIYVSQFPSPPKHMESGEINRWEGGDWSTWSINSLLIFSIGSFFYYFKPYQAFSTNNQLELRSSITSLDLTQLRLICKLHVADFDIWVIPVLLLLIFAVLLSVTLNSLTNFNVFDCDRLLRTAPATTTSSL